MGLGVLGGHRKPQKGGVTWGEHRPVSVSGVALQPVGHTE